MLLEETPHLGGWRFPYAYCNSTNANSDILWFDTEVIHYLKREATNNSTNKALLLLTKDFTNYYCRETRYKSMSY